MGRLTLLLLLLLPEMALSAIITTGIDNIGKTGPELLQMKRVGLITNHTGRSSNGTSTVDILANTSGVRLAALLSPEHGIRGEDDEKVSSGIDLKTGLAIHSLYGKSCRPTAEMLEGIDILVFDIQDIGTRFYTYTGTMHHALVAAKNKGIPIVVLDRPNPVGGVVVAGAMPDAASVLKRLSNDITGCRSLTVTHQIPTRHGMTMAELASMINSEAAIGADLRIIPMKGWTRGMTWSETGLAWVNPSPNMKDQTAAFLYPGFGILEATNISVARGTDRPFHLYGAPWLNPKAVLAKLPAIAGFSFASKEFTPTAPGHPYRDKRCNGIEVTVTDAKTADPMIAGLYLLRAIYLAHPDKYRASTGFHNMIGDPDAWQMLTTGGMPPEKVAERWRIGVESFMVRRARYLLY